MAKHNDGIMPLVTAYTNPVLQALNEYLEMEKAVREAAEVCGVDVDLMIAEAEALARATTFSTVEAMGFVIDRTLNGAREVDGHA